MTASNTTQPPCNRWKVWIIHLEGGLYQGFVQTPFSRKPLPSPLLHGADAAQRWLKEEGDKQAGHQLTREKQQTTTNPPK